MPQHSRVPDRVRLEDGRAALLVERWSCDPVFDGSNHVCAVSGGQWSCVDLARTRSGVWVRIDCGSGPSGGYQGARDTFVAITAAEAAGLAAALGADLPELDQEVV